MPIRNLKSNSSTDKEYFIFVKADELKVFIGFAFQTNKNLSYLVSPTLQKIKKTIINNK
jgi:hypothetical protein